MKSIDFLHIDMSLVAIGVAKQADIWKNDYGNVLLGSSNARLTALLNKIIVYEEAIVAETTDLEDLKSLLNTIAEIQESVMDTELEMLDINERYRTLLRYNIAVSDEEKKDALSIEKRFRQMYCDGRTRDLRLVDTKTTFREVTQHQDVDFRAELDVLREEFLDAGMSSAV